MYRQGAVRVITKDSVAGCSVELSKLLDDPSWETAVQQSPLSAYYFTAMSYEDFISSPTSRVLSYRWADKISLSCSCNDPAGLVSTFKGDLALSVLQTPPGEWTALWADALNHLNDVAGLTLTLQTMGSLYLAASTLPQYFCIGNYESTTAALTRGWMHQELSYGTLDKPALASFIGICFARHMEQTNGRPFRGNPFYLDGPALLSKFVAKRFHASAEASNMTFKAMVWHAKVHGIEGMDDGFDRNVSAEDAQSKYEHLLNLLAAKQISDSSTENLAQLQSNATLAWSVILAAANSNFWEPADMYVAGTAIIGSAIGSEVSPTRGVWPLTPHSEHVSLLRTSWTLCRGRWATPSQRSRRGRRCRRTRTARFASPPQISISPCSRRTARCLRPAGVQSRSWTAGAPSRTR